MKLTEVANFNSIRGEAVTDINIPDTAKSLDRFLASVERRAFRMAVLATQNQEDALDIVQDAMIKLVKGYAGKSEQDWGPLFQRILQSTLNDWFRRRKVRQRWQAVLTLAGFGNAEYDEAEERPDAIQQAPARHSEMPSEQLASAQSMAGLEKALQSLPLRQQQAFLLRAWEGLDVAATAVAMGCSQGSVKTHYSRAVHSLRVELEAYR